MTKCSIKWNDCIDAECDIVLQVGEWAIVNYEINGNKGQDIVYMPKSMWCDGEFGIAYVWKHDIKKPYFTMNKKQRKEIFLEWIAFLEGKEFSSNLFFEWRSQWDKRPRVQVPCKRRCGNYNTQLEGTKPTECNECMFKRWEKEIEQGIVLSLHQEMKELGI